MTKGPVIATNERENTAPELKFALVAGSHNTKLVFPDETASDLICQDSLNETDVSGDLNLYFSNLTDAGTSLRVLCCSYGKNIKILLVRAKCVQPAEQLR